MIEEIQTSEEWKSFEMSFSFTIEMPPARGASLLTLKRRQRYGGRKGRSAARRLRAAGIGTWVNYGPIVGVNPSVITASPEVSP